MIDYFNYLPLGGGDDLFWFEIVNWKLVGFMGLMKRNYVKSVLENTAKFQKKTLLGVVPIVVYHFFHGNMKNRSYTQRQYLLLTQYPWKDTIMLDDENGLLKWKNVNHYFY